MPRLLEIKRFKYSGDLYFNGFPASVSLEVTNRCNLKCSHCHHTYRSRMVTGDLRQETLEKIRQHLGNEIKNISLNGLGEPLLSAQWDVIYNACLEAGNLNISFITNGVLPLPDPEKLISDNIALTFSIDGASPPIYRHIRRADTFERVISNIKTIDEYKKNRGSVHPSLGAIFVVTAQNMHEMPDFVRLAHKIGLSHVTFTHLVAHFESQLIEESAFFRQEEHDRHLLEAQRKADEFGITIVHMGAFDKTANFPKCPSRNWLYQNSNGDIRCGLTEDWCMVNFNGHIQVCCAPDSLIAGDLRENSLFEIWNGAVYRRLKTGLSHSFEKTCGKMCNLRQSLSLDDIRSFLCRLYETYDYDPGKVIRQPYSITELNGIFETAIEALRAGNISSVLENSERVLETEPLAFEAENVRGIAFAFLGNKDKAAQCFVRAYEICKDYDAAIVNLRALCRASS